jgi:hypothetical protein
MTNLTKSIYGCSFIHLFSVYMTVLCRYRHSHTLRHTYFRRVNTRPLKQQYMYASCLSDQFLILSALVAIGINHTSSRRRGGGRGSRRGGNAYLCCVHFSPARSQTAAGDQDDHTRPWCRIHFLDEQRYVIVTHASEQASTCSRLRSLPPNVFAYLGHPKSCFVRTLSSRMELSLMFILSAALKLLIYVSNTPE